MDFEKLEADVTMIIPCHYTAGREGRSIDKVILHHNAGDLTVEDCYRVWSNREASAQYQVESNGRIGQLVNDWDTAWHAGDWDANVTSIGIEHADCSSDPWRISDECLESGAHLTAAVCKMYGLGRPAWGVNVFGHSDFSATACPASLAVGGADHDRYMQRAGEWYDAMVGGTQPAPVQPSAPATPDPAPSSPNVPDIRYRVRVNGEWLDEMVNHTDTGGSGDDFAGNIGSPFEYIAIDMPGWYQVCTEANGWLSRIRGYNINDLEDGCAGDGSPINAIRCYYETQNPDSTGWLAIEYNVHSVSGQWLPAMHDLTDTGGSNDNYAGNGSYIDGFRASLVKA